MGIVIILDLKISIFRNVKNIATKKIILTKELLLLLEFVGRF